MLLKAMNANNETYDIDVPKAVKINDKICNTIGMIQTNNGVFLICQNANVLSSIDFTTIQNFVKNAQFQIKTPTLVEYALIKFLTNNIQQKINNLEINPNQLINVFSDINKYVNTHPDLLINMSQLDNKDDMVKNNVQNLFGYFDDAMKHNTYFKKQEVEGTKPVVEQINEPQIVQPEIKMEENIVEKPTYPPYDEMTVTAILSNPQNNFDINTFINLYINDFNTNQIDLLLTNFKLNENQISALNAKKQAMVINEGKAQTNQNIQAKTKVFALPGRKEGKEAAFVDTLLLSFTIGTFCGIYLMYFVLTIMS